MLSFKKVTRVIPILTFATVSTMLAGASISQASPVPTHKCNLPKGISLIKDDPQSSLGEFIYVGENATGLVGYAEPQEQLPLATTSGSVRYYSNGDITFIAYPGGGLLLGGNMRYEVLCEEQQDTGLSEGGDGLSMGSIVRDVPHPDAIIFDKLQPGQEISFRENVGHRLDGYDWFSINDANQELLGFVWGGTLCSLEFPIPGVTGQC